MKICNFFPQSPLLIVSFLQLSLPQPDMQFSYMFVTCHTCLIIPDLIILVISVEEYKS